MVNIRHQDLTGEYIHTPFSFIYADQEEREAATGFSSEDVYKLAVQENSGDPSFWLLTGISPITWKRMG